MARSFDEIVADVLPLLREVYEAGGEARAEAMRQKLASLMEGEPVEQRGPRAESQGVASDAQRSAPGTVKPRILEVLQENPAGLTTPEVTEYAGVKYNSARGTLWSLQKEGRVRRSGDRWLIADETSSAPDAHSEPDDGAKGDVFG